MTAEASPTFAGVGVLAAFTTQSGAGCDFSLAAAECQPGSTAAQQTVKPRTRDIKMRPCINAPLLPGLPAQTNSPEAMDQPGPIDRPELRALWPEPIVPDRHPRPSGRTREDPDTRWAWRM